MKDKIVAFDKKLFLNIGSKLKILSKIVFWIGVLASVIGCIAVFVFGIYTTILEGDWSCALIAILGLVGIPCIGTLISWLSVLIMYAFGELVENSAICAKDVKKV